MSVKAYQKVGSPAGSVGSTSNVDDDFQSTASPKRGRKESEQRRRVLMNQYFDELVMLLSMVSEKDIPRKMDKVTTLREAVSCIQVYYDLSKATEKEKTANSSPKAQKTPKTSPKSGKNVEQCLLDPGQLLSFFIDAYDMFLIVVSESGRILYSTELITSLLGHLQTRLVGQNIYDYIHKEDQDALRKLFDATEYNERIQTESSPIIAYPPKRFDCRFQLYGGETGCLPQFLPFLCLSYLRKWNHSASKCSSSLPPSPVGEDIVPPTPTTEQHSCLIILGKLPTTFTLIDLSVGTNDVNFEFEMRITCEGRIIDLDKHSTLVFGYMDYEIIGSSFFEYIDPYHILDVGEELSTILSSGLGTTTPYRILTKGGRYVWLISKGYLSYDPWNNKPDHILLMNRTLGSDQVLPEHRFFRSRKLLPDTDGNETYKPTPIKKENPVHPSKQPSCKNSTQGHPGPSYMTQASQSTFPLHQTTSNISLNPLTSTPMQIEMPLKQQQQQSSMSASLGSLPGLQLPPDISLLLSSSIPLPPTPTITQSAATQSIQDIQKQLDQKNQELFELQRKLLEQQMLFEKERNQFYMVTQHVMRCITSVNSFPMSGQMDMLVKASSAMPSALTSTPAPHDMPVTCSDFAGEGMSSWCDTLIGNFPPQQSHAQGGHLPGVIASHTVSTPLPHQLPTCTSLHIVQPPSTACLPTFQPPTCMSVPNIASLADKNISGQVSVSQPQYPVLPTNTQQHQIPFGNMGISQMSPGISQMSPGISQMSPGIYPTQHQHQSLADHNAAIYEQLQSSQPHSIQSPVSSISGSLLSMSRAKSFTDILGIQLPSCNS